MDIKEVYRRGITRKRPASEKGEELRDVIVWLSVVHCAKEGDTVAFISRDSGFWDGDAGLHSDISLDISSSGSDIRVYRHIEEFNKANALNSRPWEAHEINQLLDMRSLDAQIIKKAKAYYEGSDWGDRVIAFRAGSVLSGSFESGTLYEVEAGTKFAEVPYRVQLEVTLVSRKLGLDEILNMQWRELGSELVSVRSVRRLVSLLSLQHPEVDEIERKFRVSVTGLISMRIVDSQPQPVEVDTADFGNLEFDRET